MARTISFAGDAERDMKYNKAKIISAITSVISCEECPYPCYQKGHASTYTCQRHWYEMLSDSTDHRYWHDIRDELFEMFSDDPNREW